MTFVKQKSGKLDFTLNLVADFYVHEKFFADNPFKIVEGMLYEKFRAIKLEVKGRLNKDTLKVYPDYHCLKDGDDQMSFDYPLVSDSKLLLYIGENEEKSNTFEALLMPAYNNPICLQIPPAYNNEILYEFFYP